MKMKSAGRAATAHHKTVWVGLEGGHDFLRAFFNWILLVNWAIS
jgi:hypothetical protein